MLRSLLRVAAAVCVIGASVAVGYLARGQLERPRQMVKFSTASAAFFAHERAAYTNIWVMDKLRQGDVKGAIQILDLNLDMDITALSPTFEFPSPDHEALECDLAAIRAFRKEFPIASSFKKDVEEEVLRSLPTSAELLEGHQCMVSMRL